MCCLRQRISSLRTRRKNTRRHRRGRALGWQRDSCLPWQRGGNRRRRKLRLWGVRHAGIDVGWGQLRLGRIQRSRGVGVRACEQHRQRGGLRGELWWQLRGLWGRGRRSRHDEGAGRARSSRRLGGGGSPQVGCRLLWRLQNIQKRRRVFLPIPDEMLICTLHLHEGIFVVEDVCPARLPGVGASWLRLAVLYCAGAAVCQGGSL
mmetsp:Transcript_125398/g.313300  ORF Transcript_125398/g.313300 Transcript_125398/m.313300 type:complete len:205 (-) Transcript_125398:416-1030(-)